MVNLRVRGHEVAQAVAHEPVHIALAGHHVDVAALDLADAVHLRHQVLLLAVLPAHVAREHLPGVGGHHAAAVALQQGHAALLLEQADGAAHCRGVHVEHVGGAAHRAAVQHMHEVAHAARVELVVHGAVSWGLG
jgi:hypothetical protein